MFDPADDAGVDVDGAKKRLDDVDEAGKKPEKGDEAGGRRGDGGFCGRVLERLGFVSDVLTSDRGTHT